MGQMNSMTKRFAWGDWEQEETVYGALLQLLHLWDSEEKRGGERAEVLKSSHEGGGGGGGGVMRGT